jgi:hypothetical protein
MSIQKICAGFETSLAAKLTAGGTSFTLSSHLTKKGVELSGEYGFILGEGTSVEEWLYGTVTAGVVTIIKRGLDPEDPETEVPALKFDHDRGTTSVKITDYPFLGLVRQYLGGEKSLPAPLKYETHHAPTEDTELIDKKYAQDLFTGAIGTASSSAAGTVFTDRNMGSKPIVRTIIANEQSTPDMTIQVAPFSLAEIDKHVNYAGGNSPTFVAPVTNPRIDILVYDIAAVALEVRAGSENASPVAPALESGDIAIAKIYHKVGETLIKNTSDGTNGYIMALYDPAVTRGDVLLNTDTTVMKYETLPAYEDVIAGDLLKIINDSGTYKLKKVVGIGTSISGTRSATGGTGNALIVEFINTDKIVLAYNATGNVLTVQVGTISGSTITFGTAYTTFTYLYTAADGEFGIKKVVNDSFIIVYGWSNGSNSSKSYAKAATVSGTTMTFGSEVELGSEAVNSRPIVFIDELDSAKFIVSSIRQNGLPYDSVVSVSGTTITASAAALSSFGGTAQLHSLMKLTTDVYIMFAQIGSVLNYKVNTVSGTTITVGATTVVTGSIFISFAKGVSTSSSSGFLVYGKSGTATSIYCRTFTRSGAVLTFQTENAFTNTHGITSNGNVNLAKVDNFIYYASSISPRNVIKFSFDLVGNIRLITSITPLLNTVLMGLFTVYNNRLFVFESISSTTITFISLLLDHDEFVTSSNSSISAGANIPLVSAFTGFLSLISGNDYYINSAATGLTLANTYQKVGKAISSTKIIK